MFKSSIYNILLPYSNGYLAYNTFTCAMLFLKQTIYERVSEILINPNLYYKEEYFKILKDNGFIIDKTIEELNLIYTQHDKVKFSNNFLALQIIPNLDCNFCCSYCFENKRSEYLRGQNLKNVERFLRKKALQVEAARVTWMGGEPLLSWEEIKLLSEPLMEISDYQALLITNGFGFTDDIINDLGYYKILEIQITLDGFSNIHNKRRNCKKPIDSYSIIKTNIDKIISKYGNKIKLTINTNLDYLNIDSYFKLIEDLLIYKKYINISISRTCYKSSNKEIPLKKFLEIQKGFYSKISKMGFLCNVEYLPSEYQYIGCFCEMQNGFIIGQDSCIYKCLIQHNDGKNIGTIIDDGEVEYILNNESEFWNNYSIKLKENCKVCSYLPICMGGCPLNIDESQCEVIRERIDNRIVLAYEKV